MSGPGELKGLSHSATAFAWRAGRGPLHAAHGPAAKDASSLGLNYRRFSKESGPGKQNLWNDFAAHADLALASEFIAETVDALEEPFPFSPAAELPSPAEWAHYCEGIDRALADESLQKLVPARAVFHALSSAAHARLIAELPARLFARPQDGSYRFFLKQNDSVFFGASPELLFRRARGKIFVPAIAGTRAHGPGRATLELASAELLASAKDRAEQALVTEGIAQSLRGLGLKPSHPPKPTILPARNLVHLFTPIEAEDPGIPAEELIAALHPTPAVGGTPKKEALRFIAAHEPWERGLFASPLLFTGPAGQICIVAIRSGLLTSKGLFFFAGAGYVKGSTAEGEWEETARKFESLRELLKEGK